MDEVAEQQTETGEPDGQQKTKIFLILAIVIAFIIVTLLYFGIIPSKPQQNNKPAAITTPSPTAEFKYDTTKAKTLLTQYVKKTLKPEFLPANIEVKQGLTSQGRLETIKYEFGSLFTEKGATITANFNYKEKTNTSDGYMIFAQLKNMVPTDLTTITANSLLSSYFLKPYSLSDCGIKKNIFYCENFQTTADGKMGYGIFSSANGTRIYSCFAPKESSLYKEASYCLKPTL
jgi:hypothetical protein